MTLIEALQELLSCETVDGGQATHAYLKEDDRSAKLQKLKLSGLTPGMLVLHIDNGRKVFYGRPKKLIDVCMSPLFRKNSAYDHNCGCDAVLIHTKRNSPECEIFYIELKSDNPRGYSGQFRSTRCFFYYVQFLLKEFWEVDMKIKQEHFIVFHTDPSGGRSSLGKTSVRYSLNYVNSPDSPKKVPVQNGDEVRYHQLF